MPGTDWQLVAFGRHGRRSLAQQRTGELYVHFMSGSTIASEGFIAGQSAAWYTPGSGDFDGDGKDDLIRRNSTTGEVNILLMDGLTVKDSGTVRVVDSFDWEIVRIADFDGDGRADILWRHFPTGNNYLWLMNGKYIRPAEGSVYNITPPWWTAVDN